MNKRLTASQIRGARGMLNWSTRELARTAGLSASTIKRIEGVAPEPVSDEVHAIVRSALEGAGMRFSPECGRGEGVWYDRC